MEHRFKTAGTFALLPVEKLPWIALLHAGITTVDFTGSAADG
jgi:hypothetical protein